jgi:hypothetical protein
MRRTDSLESELKLEKNIKFVVDSWLSLFRLVSGIKSQLHGDIA